jgi:hypothetical protein
MSDVKKLEALAALTTDQKAAFGIAGDIIRAPYGISEAVYRKSLMDLRGIILHLCGPKDVPGAPLSEVFWDEAP